MSKTYLELMRIVLHGRASARILIGTILSFAFSISVILCTVGLMDGFDYLLKSGLRNASGDVIITSRKNFFSDSKISSKLISIDPAGTYSPLIQTEGFALANSKSQGVLIKGIEPQSFFSVTGLKVDPGEGVIIGKELAKNLRIKEGENLALALGKGNESSGALPAVRIFLVKKIISHGIYQKDLRFIYMEKEILADILNLEGRSNVVLAGYFDPRKPLETLDVVKAKTHALKTALAGDFRAKPFWDEYDFLIEAVKVEKLSISLILQLIVVVAIFNILAFVIYVMEKKSQEFFFLRAVGLSMRDLLRFWFTSLVVLWLISSVLAYFFSRFFDWTLANVSFFQVPGEIYVLSSLSLRLSIEAYVTVYAVSLIWILAAAGFGYLRLRSKPIIQGLRQEFS